MKTIKAKVHMLPTENGGGGIIFKDTQPPKGLYFRLNHTPEFIDCVYYHLYITTDEEIKEGDFVFINGEVMKFIKMIGDNVLFHRIILTNLSGKEFSGHLSMIQGKVIATTDPKLNQCEGCRRAKHSDSIYTCSCISTSLPQIHQSFIEGYCKAGGIDKVLVEMEYTGKGKWITGEWTKIYKPKLNPDNTIIIHSVEEKYTKEQREDIIQLIKSAFYKGMVHERGSKIDIDKWIEENL